MESPQVGTTLLLCQGVEHLSLLLEAVLVELRLQRGMKVAESDALETELDAWKSLPDFQRRRREIFSSRQLITDKAEPSLPGQ